MGESVVDIGLRLLATPEPDEAVEAPDADDALMPALIALVTGLCDRLSTLEAKVEQNFQAIVATRVRRPVRDDLGTILYVVDELQAPLWAQPMMGEVDTDG